MSKHFCLLFIYAILMSTVWLSVVLAIPEGIEKAEDKFQMGILYKILPFHKEYSSGGDVAIIVVKDKKFSNLMRKLIGKSIGKSKLTTVIDLDVVPDTAPDNPKSIIYLGDIDDLKKLKAYSRKHKILSISGDPVAIEKGISLGVAILDGKPKVLLNLTATKDEGIQWNAALLKLAIKTK